MVDPEVAVVGQGSVVSGSESLRPGLNCAFLLRGDEGRDAQATLDVGGVD